MRKPSPLAKRLAKRLIDLGMTFSVDIEDLCIQRNQWAICNHIRGCSEQFGWEFIDVNGQRPTVTWPRQQCSDSSGPWIVGGLKPISELVRCKYIDVYIERGDNRIEIIGANKP